MQNAIDATALSAAPLGSHAAAQAIDLPIMVALIVFVMIALVWSVWMLARKRL